MILSGLCCLFIHYSILAATYFPRGFCLQYLGRCGA